MADTHTRAGTITPEKLDQPQPAVTRFFKMIVEHSVALSGNGWGCCDECVADSEERPEDGGGDGRAALFAEAEDARGDRQRFRPKTQTCAEVVVLAGARQGGVSPENCAAWS